MCTLLNCGEENFKCTFIFRLVLKRMILSYSFMYIDTNKLYLDILDSQICRILGDFVRELEELLEGRPKQHNVKSRSLRKTS